MYEIYTPSNSTNAFCLVVNPEYFFADHVLIPWIDMAVYGIVPSILITIGNTFIIYKLAKAGIRRTDMVKFKADKQAHIKVAPVFLLVSTFFVATSLPICVYYTGKKCNFNIFVHKINQYKKFSVV